MGAAYSASVLLIASAIACGQVPSPHDVVLGPNIRVGRPGEDISQVWAYADPTDARYLMACGSFVYRELNAKYAFAYSSADSGATWARTLLDDHTRWVTEVNCTYGEDGQAYFAGGESDTSTGKPRHDWGHLQLFSSSDHGVTWKRAGNRAEGWLDWTLLAALPAGKKDPASLVIFANSATDKLGHKWDRRPVALEATGGAESFSDLVAPAISSFWNFGGGSVVLPDRTALFISGTVEDIKDSNASHAALKVFAYSASDRTLQVRAVLRGMPSGRFSLWPALVQDTGAGRFHNRLYAVWSDTDARQLWLATSDDNGYHWSSRAVFSTGDSRVADCPNDPPRYPDIRIALNRDGILGVLWSRDTNELLFASSSDGGQTFYSSERVASHAAGPLTVESAVPYNEWWLANVLAEGKEPIIPDIAHVGLSVRLAKPQGLLYDFSLAADAKNRFHALWAELDDDGFHALMTRTITVPASVSGNKTKLAEGPATLSCTEGNVPLHPLLPGPPPLLDLAGQQDLTQSFDLQISHIQYTPTMHVVNADVTLVNKGDKTVHGPLTLYGVGIHSDYGVPIALNAAGMTRGQPFWDLSAVIPASGLPAKAGSKPIKLQFKIDHFKPVPTGDAVAMLVRVFGKNAAH